MRTFGLVCWCLLAWVLLTWTATTEVLVTGLTVAVVCAVALTPLGPVEPPWRALGLSFASNCKCLGSPRSGPLSPGLAAGGSEIDPPQCRGGGCRPL